ncbi:hypothetical protein V492_03966 [Pseudogymnoascus sp. VKM F-4246]|nr:hypothetical protein V492_03966 [Pseudogymnoascus sp. VKM F-4246]
MRVLVARKAFELVLSTGEDQRLACSGYALATSVTSTSQLQAYEYTTDTTIDISEYGTFVAEFVEIVIERKLQHKFGLKINDYNSKIGVSVSQKEFEFPEEQCTITIPVTLPLPEDTHEISVDTVWGTLDVENGHR